MPTFYFAFAVMCSLFVSIGASAVLGPESMMLTFGSLGVLLSILWALGGARK